jgi:hypothetical protein
LTNLSVGKEEYFNAAMLDLHLRVGVEIPIASDWLLLGQFTYLQGMKSVNPSNNLSVSYDGVIMFVGARLSTF